jgi:hypothetical protein
MSRLKTGLRPTRIEGKLNRPSALGCASIITYPYIKPKAMRVGLEKTGLRG